VICGALLLVTIALTTPKQAVLTRAGADVRDHLLGLKLYIGLAEADRLRMLQGPGGALTDGDVFRITERLLGWAVLFGFEKEWARLLEVYGQQAGLDVAALDLPIFLLLAADLTDWSPSDVAGDPSDPGADGTNGDSSADGGPTDGGGADGGGTDSGGADLGGSADPTAGADFGGIDFGGGDGFDLGGFDL